MNPAPFFRCSLKNLIALLALGGAALLLCVTSVQAQTLTVSPSSLSFGIPTGTSPAVSSADAVTVNIGGSGNVSFSSATVSGGSPFTITGNTCVGTLAAPTTCTISINLSTSSSTLMTDTLSISFTGGSTPSPLMVPLSGAYGAIKLFDETNVTAAPPSASFTTPYTIASKTLNLTCPASPTGILSSTPGTFYSNTLSANTYGYVLVDNYITLYTGPGPTPVSDPDSTLYPAGNVCGGTGAVADSNGTDFFADCFTSNYQDYALGLPLPPTVGLDPDSFANPGNAALLLERPNATNAGGVPPIDVHSFLTGNASGPTYPEQALFTLLSSGYEGVYDNSTLFLVTNCTAPGIIPGASVTLNPVSTTNPSSETQTANLDSSTGQNISFTASDAVAVQQGTVTFTNGIVPIVTDYPVPQQLFSQLVAGTSAAPAVCFRMTGETDTFGQPMCKAFLFECYDPGTNTTSSSNCTPYQSSARNVLFTAQFASPDGPIPPVVPAVYNYLVTQPWAPNTPYTVGQTIVDPYGNVQIVTSVSVTGGTSGSAAPFLSTETPGTATADNAVAWLDQGPNACANLGPGDACVMGTGPGLLMGSDNWLCSSSGEGLPCTGPLTVTTETTGTTYYANNCVMEAPLFATDLCPFDVLTQYQGAADNLPGGPTKPQSIFIPVANMPLPSASATFGATAQSGWINNLTTAAATFTSGSATYPNPAPATNPSANGFNQAAPYSLTYGVSAAPNLPDTTYPVPGDQIIYNQYTNGSTDLSSAPLCNNSGTTPFAFTPQAPYSALSTLPGYFNGLTLSDGGLYYLHYFTTDCAYTEGLVFNPTPSQFLNATANWASFPYLAFGVDTQAPTLGSCSTMPASPTYPGGGGWYSSNVTETCQATDNASGIGPLTDGNAYSAIDNTTGVPIAVAAIANTNNNVLQGSLNANLSWMTACPSSSTCAGITIGPLTVSDLAGNTSASVAAVSFNIDMQAPTITGPTLAGNPAIYNGTPIVVSYSCSDTGSGVQACTLNNTNPTPTYTSGGGPACTSNGPGTVFTCSATISAAAVQSGSLSVTGTDNVGNNYTTPTVQYTVGMATPTLSVANSPVTYNGSPQAATLTTSVPGTVSNVLYNGSATVPTKAGPYAVTANFAPTNSTDYSSLSNAPAGNFVISPATPTLSVNNSPVTYNGSPQAATFTTSVPGTVSNVLYNGSATVPTNGGNYAVTANFVPTDSTDYSSLSNAPAGNFVINLATPTITFGAAPTPTYPGSNFTVSATTNSNGTLTYSYVSGPCTLVSATAGTFSPTGVGTCVVQANTLATSNFTVGSKQQSVTISSAAWTITPMSYTFPTLSVGQKYHYTFVVTNPTGGATTSIKVGIPGSQNEGGGSGEIDPDDFVITSNKCTNPLAGGNSCSVTVTWTPDSDNLPLYQTGGSLAYLQVINTSTNALLVQATMQGQAIDPTVTLTPQSNAFTATSTTTQIAATLSNPSTQLTDLILGTLSISSGGKYFKLATGTNSCTNGSTIAPGAPTCNIYVTFTPPSGTAAVNGQVTIPSNAANGPLTVSLSGKR